MKLLSFEKAILCRFIQSNVSQREAIMVDAKNDPQTSAALIRALDICSQF